MRRAFFVFGFGNGVNELYKKIETISNEFPELNFELNNNNVFIHLSGELHAVIIKKLFKDRLNIDIDFSDPIIKYKETISEEVYGVGHFEPLRHYAEVIVKIKPLSMFRMSFDIYNTNL